MLNLIGSIISFIIIIILIRKKINFGIAIILGSIILGLFSLNEITIIDIPKAFIQAVFYSFENQKFFSETVELALLMTLIFMLAKTMQETGAIKILIKSLKTIFTKGGSLGVIPAIYGLMPIPGGALFSAPTIDQEGKKYNIDQNQKNFLNVWFRHIWFPIFPLSAAMILICSNSFSNIEIKSLIIAHIPSFIIFIFIGIIYLRYFIRKNEINNIKTKLDLSGLKYLVPPLIPVVLYWSLHELGVSISNTQAFLIGMLFSFIALYFFVNRDSDCIWEWSVLRRSITWKLALAIIGIMIFREMFQVSKVDVIISELITNQPFPQLFMLIIIPLILGVLTGYNLGAIALSYFIVEPFFPVEINIIGVTSIIFMSALVGYLVSPIHLCNVLSSDYLKTDTTRMYKMYLPAVTILLISQIIFIILFYRV